MEEGERIWTPEARGAAERWSRWTGWIAVGAGGVVLAGWWLGVPALTHIIPGRISMKANAALSFISLGLSLVFFHARHSSPRLGREGAVACALLSVLAGGLSLYETAAGVDLGIDQLIAADEPSPIATRFPGRIPEPAAISFVILGSIVCAHALGHAGLWKRYLLAVPAGIALLNLFLHLFGTGHFHPWPGITAMPFHGAALVLVLSCGVLLVRPAGRAAAIFFVDSISHHTLYRVLPTVILLITLGTVLRLYAEDLGWYERRFGLALNMTAIVSGIAAILIWSGLSLHDIHLRRLDLEGQAAELARLNAELSRTAAELGASVEELKGFSYSVSHDLRAPLRAVDGFARALEEDCGDRLDAVGRGHLERILNGCRTMGQLIDGMLALSRLTRVELARETVNLAEMADGILETLRRTDPGRRVKATVHPDLSVQADPRMARALLENLLGNAWKFTSTRDVAHLEVGSFVAGDGGRVWYVRDDGVGFDPAFGNKLFVPFQRLHPRGQFDGTGIGLATAARVARRHGGRIWADGMEGRGATFYFTFGSDGGERMLQEEHHNAVTSGLAG